MTFQVEDYIEYENEHIERLKDIFVHELLREERRIFVRLTRMLKLDETDAVLDLSTLRLKDIQVMIDLSAINSKKLYIVSVKRRSDELQRPRSESNNAHEELQLERNDLLLHCT